jgi:predicted Zn-dependent peptidase
MRSCLTEIVFPEKEIDLYKEKSLMRLKVNQEKNEYVADMSLKSALFGDKHPYGYETLENDIKAIYPAGLLQYYSKSLCAQNASLFVSGEYTDQDIDLIAKIIDPADWGKGSLPEYPSYQPKPAEQKDIRHNIPGSVQSSIAMGKHLFNRQHPDFTGVAMLNTVFGGYFGSRLMQNIREEKGMTYGIYSEIQTYKHGGLLLISTETGIEYTTACLREIHREASKLRSNSIGKEELSQARNYMLGKLLSRTDGPFNKSSAYRNLLIEGFDEKKFETVVEEVRNIDNKRLRSLAEQYLHTENMYCVVVS